MARGGMFARVPPPPVPARSPGTQAAHNQYTHEACKWLDSGQGEPVAARLRTPKHAGQSINKCSSKAVELRVTVVGDGWGPGDMLY